LAGYTGKSVPVVRPPLPFQSIFKLYFPSHQSLTEKPPRSRPPRVLLCTREGHRRWQQNRRNTHTRHCVSHTSAQGAPTTGPNWLHFFILPVSPRPARAQRRASSREPHPPHDGKQITYLQIGSVFSNPPIDPRRPQWSPMALTRISAGIVP
jgi:hypothetical protein